VTNNDNINDYIIKAAWAALCNPANPKYYLPNLIVNGLTDGEMK
jgi:hypothetical protein